MRICIDLTSLDDNFSGIERFALSITKELIKNTEHQWILLFKNHVYKDFFLCAENVEKVVIKGKNKLLFNQFILPLKLLSINADRFFFPAFPAPFLFFNKKSYTTIHDLSCWDCPKSNRKKMIIYFKLMYWKASINGKKIVTVSKFSKQRISQILHVNPKNIVVIYNGISERFNKNPITKLEKERIKKKYSLPDNYILCLSTLEPRKNLRLLLDAYSILFEENIVEEIVLAGRKGWKMNDFLKGYNQAFLNHVHFTGFIEDNDLPIVYKLGKLFIFPSLYEGFGIPPLEALACGIPVISSDATSLPEILGNKAIYFKSGVCASLVDRIRNIDYKQMNVGIEDELSVFRWSIQATKLLMWMVEDV